MAERGLNYVFFSAYSKHFLICTGESTMRVSYDKLWKLLIDKNMTKTEMRKAARISTNILAKMGKNEPVSMETLAKICVALDCSLNDIVEIKGGTITEK